MVRNIIYILSFVILLVSCSHEVVIDNPTKEDLKVKIDGKELLLKASSLQKVKLPKGVNQITSTTTAGDTLFNEEVDISDNGLLNITNTSYVVWKDIFCEDDDYEEYKTKLNLKDTVMVDGLEFIEIDLELYDNAFIPKTWEIDLGNEMPETIEIEDSEQYKILSKIYRATELKKAFNYYGDYDFNDLTEAEINKIINNTEEN